MSGKGSGHKPPVRNPGPSQLDRIEAKLDVLIAALAQEAEEEQVTCATLDESDLTMPYHGSMDD